jgi:hypothetical protein
MSSSAECRSLLRQRGPYHEVKRGPRVRVVVPGDPVEYEPLKAGRARGSSGDGIVRA